MKIIVKGDNLEIQREKAIKWRRLIKHKYCGSKLVIDASDIQTNAFVDTFISCPVCNTGKKLHFIPKYVIDYAKGRF